MKEIQKSIEPGQMKKKTVSFYQDFQSGGRTKSRIDFFKFLTQFSKQSSFFRTSDPTYVQIQTDTSYTYIIMAILFTPTKVMELNSCFSTFEMRECECKKEISHTHV